MTRVAAVLGLYCLTLAAGWWSKAGCLVDDGGWTGSEEYLGWCYTDVVPLYVHRGFADGAVPYVDEPLEYPVLTGAQMWLLSLPVDSAAEYFHVTAALGAAFVLATVGVLAAGGLPPVRLAWVAAAPTLAAYAFLNWDPLPT